MLEDFRLQVFLTVVDQKSFTKAAAKLKVSQPAVSQNIAELERLLDKKLFVRLKNETLLTPEGEVFLVYVNEIMSKCESLENMFCKIPPTTVRISASEELYAYLIGPAIDSFASIHPDVVFERCLFGDADLTLQLRPSGEEAAEAAGEKIAEIRMSISPVQKTDDRTAIREKTSCFDIIFKPSEAFSCTRLCRLLKAFLIS
jgi:DNA-binding transcriptional LysR family regulator